MREVLGTILLGRRYVTAEQDKVGKVPQPKDQQPSLATVDIFLDNLDGKCGG